MLSLINIINIFLKLSEHSSKLEIFPALLLILLSPIREPLFLLSPKGLQTWDPWSPHCICLQTSTEQISKYLDQLFSPLSRNFLPTSKILFMLLMCFTILDLQINTKSSSPWASSHYIPPRWLGSCSIFHGHRTKEPILSYFYQSSFVSQNWSLLSKTSPTTEELYSMARCFYGPKGRTFLCLSLHRFPWKEITYNKPRSQIGSFTKWIKAYALTNQEAETDARGRERSALTMILTMTYHRVLPAHQSRDQVLHW